MSYQYYEYDRLQELKQKLTNDADLSDIWLFYMDHFADWPEFTDLGQPADNEYLDAVLPKKLVSRCLIGQ
ncbi:hypothetical protein [Nostoc sp. 'Peltigera malacea cyanobiont' DB3992]|uniref:hypothetical protein n=1 Tax=Nostoc sp. 'Peltigera malacea cyanobiont' DB3992 TaxID=1206980 RepID=UPI000C045ED7|nr:hypothetical protein [Nostoc sp. 'Peltigera malacea cyanobiont' DB3992]PHM07069.1 hypothetical protein CK516_29390 [Nostoc sp. 'Peltigera malacea cyanobiont' DB3992]